jgi:hypothetical protein
MTRRQMRIGRGLPGILAMGLILVLMGVPFVGMAVMASLLTCSRKGIPLALGTLVLVFLLSDFTGALIAAVGSGLMSGSICMGRSIRESMAVSSAGTAMVFVFGTILMISHSMLSYENMDMLVQLYSSAGMSSSEVAFVMNLLIYLLPALLAVWSCSGVIAAGAAARLIGKRRGTWPDTVPGGPVRLGLVPAWILILALAANLYPSSPHILKQAGVNISIFMILPYSIVGVAVFRKLLIRYPQAIFLAILTAVVFPPVAIGIMAITGVMDTWMDFRGKLDRIKEKKE